jgi:hypothetical protein
MVIQAEVCHSPHLGILVLLDAGVPVLDLVRNIVDKGAVLTSLAIGINHWGLIRAPRITLLLNMPLLLTVAADNVGVPRAIAVFGIVASFTVTSLVFLGG